METTDTITIVKRIAHAWYNAMSDDRVLAYHYCLEACGLTLNEIIDLGNTTDLDEAIDKLFSHHKGIMNENTPNYNP